MDVTHPSVGVCLSLLFYLLFVLLRAKLVVFLPKTLGHNVDETWKWMNLFMSWIHAFVSGSTAAFCFLSDPGMLTSDLIAYVTPTCCVIISFSIGYFVNDFVDIAVNKKLGLMWEVICHHIAVILLFGYNLVYVTYIGYTVLGLLVEINTFFLHSRKLLQMSHTPRENVLLRVIKVINLITFALFRGYVLSCITYGMYVYREGVSPLYYYGLLVPCMFVLLVINPILFWRLLRNDFLSRRAEKDKEAECYVNNNSDMQQANGVRHRQPNGVLH